MKFVYAIYNLMEGFANWDWIRWNQSGDKLMISDWNALINALTDLGFGCTSRESVMKNFYHYGFESAVDGRKRIAGDDGVEWSILSHTDFRRGHFDLLAGFTR
ncbi:hypothetical protein GGI21_000759, partial [Coemansia aciculifera]